MIFFCISLVYLFFTNSLQAQSEHQLQRIGSKAYVQGDYAISVQKFEQSTQLNPTSFKGFYNLGNAYYKQKQYAAAAKNYKKALDLSQTNADKARIQYNWGNALLSNSKQKLAARINKEEKALVITQLSTAIELYKQTLRLQPLDYDAKTNLATAFKLWRENNPKNPPSESKQANQAANNQSAPTNKIEHEAVAADDKDLKKLLQIMEQEDKKMQRNRNRKKKKNLNTGKKDW